MADSRVLELVEAMLQQEVMEGLAHWTPVAGTPQGAVIERGYRWPRRKSVAKLKATIRNKTRRTHGSSLRIIIRMVNQTLTGWFGYFKHSHKTAFPPLDKWIRMRLRSILRQRLKRKGRARGTDNVRWLQTPDSRLQTLSSFIDDFSNL